jgi:phytoene dehydrogenase-like protein
MTAVDAVVVGAGPNGLAAAVTLAAAGLSVRVYEGAATVGGGCRTDELTLPGFRHDVCSAVHPLALASPFFRRLDLPRRGVRMLHPDVCFAQPLDDGRAAAVHRSLDATAAALGRDGVAWRDLFAPFVEDVDGLVDTVLAPIRRVPRRPLTATRFGLVAARSAEGLAGRFRGVEAPALLSGASAHAMLPLERLPTGAFGVLLTTLAHAVGWPLVEGGSQAIADAMVGALEDLGGEVVTGQWVRSVDELPPARAVLLDVAPRQLLSIAGDGLPAVYRRALLRYRHGAGVCKLDWALSGPVPWAAEECRRAGTVHVGGSFADIARSEHEVGAGRHPERPFVLVAQPSLVDPGRAPDGKHALWGYCHVPAGSTVDMTDAIERQIERFAPGFRDLVLARSVLTAADEERLHPTYVGGDINVGAPTIRQTLFRPTVRWDNYATPLDGVYLCSSATPPGGGVHGMCGEWAARSALRHSFGIRRVPGLPSFPAAARVA